MMTGWTKHHGASQATQSLIFFLEGGDVRMCAALIYAGSTPNIQMINKDPLETNVIRDGR